MSEFTLTFKDSVEYERFIDQMRKDVLRGIEGANARVHAYSPTWIAIRDENEKKLRGAYNEGCGTWYTNYQSIGAMFKLAFRKDSVKGLRSVEDELLNRFNDELFALIDKYRKEGASI